MVSRMNAVACQLVGMLLFLTAALKIRLLLTDPFADITVSIPREILWIVAFLEIGLGWLNLKPNQDLGILGLCNVSVFTSFALFGVSRYILGYNSCGCTGEFNIPLWLLVIVDVAIVIFFLRSVENRTCIFETVKRVRSSWGGLRQESRGQLLGFFFFVVFVAVVQLPSLTPARQFIFGNPPIVATYDRTKELQVDSENALVFEISNRSSKHATVIGVATSCSCIRFERDVNGLIVEAGEKLIVPLVARPARTGNFHQRIVLFLSHPEQLELSLDVFGFVRS